MTIWTTSASGCRPPIPASAASRSSSLAIPAIRRRSSYLDAMVADPDAGVRQQVALALGEFDGPGAAAALARLLVDPEQAVARPRPTAWPN